MKRISQRISAAVTMVTCPGCGTQVTPAMAEAGTSPPEELGGKRWSFIWLKPRGATCPQCGFPLARYFGRLKWIRLFLAGVALTTLAGAFAVLGMIGGVGGWVSWTTRVLGILGLTGLLVGGIGLVVGGRHGPNEIGHRA